METLENRLNVQRIIGAVAERHGILLKPNDAAFALVTINQLVLEEFMAGLLDRVRCAMADFDEAAARVQTRAGALVASEVKESTKAIRHALESDIAAAGKQARELVVEVQQAHSGAALKRWIAVGVVCSFLLFVCGVFVGKLLR